MKRENAWYNKDGLIVGFGTRSEESDTQSYVNGGSHVQEICVKLSDLTLLGTDATVGTGIYAPQYFANAPRIPANATVQEVRITTDTVATTSDSADLLLGLYTVSPTTGVLVAVDADGLAAAGDSAVTNFDAVGETVVLGAGAGAAYVGKKTVGSDPVVVAAVKVTGSFTAGALSVHVKYSLPVN